MTSLPCLQNPPVSARERRRMQRTDVETPRTARSVGMLLVYKHCQQKELFKQFETPDSKKYTNMYLCTVLIMPGQGPTFAVPISLYIIVS